jgi:hypothetical protein
MKIPTVNEKIDITWASLTATVLSSSRYGAEYDRVKVLQEIGLAAPLIEDESFFVPPAGKPFDTRTVFPDGNITNFAGQRFKDIQDELSKYGQAVQLQDVTLMNELHELLKATTMLTPVVFKKGTQVLTFEYELALYPSTEPNVFELALWAPMPSFRVIGQSQITAGISLPSSSNRAVQATILEAVGYEPDAQGNIVAEIPKVIDQSYGIRHLIAWNWQNDPLFRVKYQYI